VYENQPQTLRPREFTPEESAAYFTAQAAGYKEPKVTYRFVGRDLDVLEIERRLLGGRNTLLLRGMGGAGKTTLLHHLAWWWQRTGFVGQVFYFGYDQRAWTRQQIMDAVARQLLGDEAYRRNFQPLGLDAQQALLAEKLRGARHLLLLDNLESVTGAELAIQHTLSKKEQAALHGFVQALNGGATLVLLGSRGPEAWLAPGTFEDNAYILPGLDPEAASELADLILAKHKAAKYRGQAELERLIRLLEGYPLALEVVLANLARQTPAEVLAALLSGGPGIEAGEIDLANPDIQKKTESILACIAYSHSNLAPEAQSLLLCLAPFTGVFYVRGQRHYIEALKRQPALADLPFDRWGEVLEQAINWGLLAWHEVDGYLRIQPTLPYFLRGRLAGQDAIRAAVETAFRERYDRLGEEIAKLIMSKDARQRQTGLAVAHIEYENLHSAVRMLLLAHQSFFNPYEALARYLTAAQDFRRHLQLSEMVQDCREEYQPTDLQGRIGLEFARCLEDTARCGLKLKQLSAAGKAYQDELRLLDTITGELQSTARKWKAAVYHQLGRVAQEQRQWAAAEGYYQQALAIYVEFDDRYSQASTYHQLGIVAEEQRQWAKAREYLLKDLTISAEFEDWEGAGITLRSLARVWRASGDATLPAAVAEILGVTPAEAESLLNLALPDEE
jgi:hypothetical protein